MKEALLQFIFSLWNLLVVSFYWICDKVLSDLAGFGTIIAAIWAVWVYRRQNMNEQANSLKLKLSQLKQQLMIIVPTCNNDAISEFTDMLVNSILSESDCDEDECLRKFLGQQDKTTYLERIICITRESTRDIRLLEDSTRTVDLLIDEIGITVPLYSKLLSKLFCLLLDFKKDTFSQTRLFSLLNSESFNKNVKENIPATSAEMSNRSNEEGLIDNESNTRIRTLLRQTIFDYLIKEKESAEENKKQVTENLVASIQNSIEKLIQAYLKLTKEEIYKISQRQIKLSKKRQKESEKVICSCLSLLKQIQSDFRDPDGYEITVLMGSLLPPIDDCNELPPLEY